MSARYDYLVAERKLAAAKRRYSECCAVAAGLGGTDATAKAVTAAYKGVEAARDELRRLAGQGLSDKWREMRKLQGGRKG